MENKEMKAKDFSKAIDKSGLKGFQFEKTELESYKVMLKRYQKENEKNQKLIGELLEEIEELRNNG